MKHKTFVAEGLALLCAAALLLGCDTTNGPEDDGGKTFSVSVSTGETKYFALRSGTAVEIDASNAVTTNWDIAFKRTRLILTNSGDTNTGGQGGVWYAGTTNFGIVSLANKGADGIPYSVDTNKYVWTGMGPAPTAQTPLNVMTFVGYDHGNGTTPSTGELNDYPSNGAFTSYLYNADQYYSQDHSGGGGGPVFTPNYKVYIIKLGNGSGYAKIQVIEYAFAGGKDNFTVKYKLLD
ncbi:MAG: HmuY family protein [Spirochaetaceae bacterium]|jgi:hypothetical protein|nr:HmuY family protein [Spirochaetaceae bacterium]